MPILSVVLVLLELFMNVVSAIQLPAALNVPKPRAKVVSAADLLSFDHYHKTCPQAEGIIQQKVGDWIQKDSTLAASIIRLHFHDCAVRVSMHSQNHIALTYFFSFVTLEGKLNSFSLFTTEANPKAH